jgi:hypothetical protein
MRTETKILMTLQKQLKQGDIKEISRKTRMSREYVGIVLNPKKFAYNEQIVQTAIEIVKKRQAEKETLLKKIA